ncbi:MAG: type II toxin-antitoxin system RelE/ParE family toxin [Abditibacteriota bacterium]|nr:type II toxin-antitoxin system RelE/ParE family toxin [Abditibacteriota bacterium]
MEIRYARAAVKVINALDRPTKQRIKKAVEGLPKGDIKPLSGSKGLYRLRVGDWRVVFSYPKENAVLIEKIAPRGDVYKGGLLCL